MPLRCLMLRNYNAETWSRFLSMEAHLDKRKDTPIWVRHKEYTEKPLTDLQQLTEDDLEQEIVQKICGILDINTFEVRPPESDGNLLDPGDCLRGLYLRASLLSHDCVGNTQLSIDDDFNMTVHASRAISVGETIFFNYGNCLKSSYERRCHLKDGKYFDCGCRRCSDPTELGTYMSSIRCNKCKSGLVVPTMPLSDIYRTSWTCQCCATVYKGILIKTTMDQIKEKMACWDPTNIQEGEELLQKLEISLAPQHYLVLE
ncbi:SET domain-containing protein, partial [Oryctes borbonicus]